MHTLDMWVMTKKPNNKEITLLRDYYKNQKMTDHAKRKKTYMNHLDMQIKYLNDLLNK